jgi:hypothetical protein
LFVGVERCVKRLEFFSSSSATRFATSPPVFSLLSALSRPLELTSIDLLLRGASETEDADVAADEIAPRLASPRAHRGRWWRGPSSSVVDADATSGLRGVGAAHRRLGHALGAAVPLTAAGAREFILCGDVALLEDDEGVELPETGEKKVRAVATERASYEHQVLKTRF